MSDRRQLLEEFARRNFSTSGDRIRVSPATTDLRTAKDWFKKVGGDLDGLIAKRLDFTYNSGERIGMQKIKLLRTADCVVGGFRYSSKGRDPPKKPPACRVRL